MEVLDPDFDTYSIESAEEDGSAFVFILYDDDKPDGSVDSVVSYSYSNIRGEFNAVKRDGKWYATRKV